MGSRLLLPVFMTDRIQVRMLKAHDSLAEGREYLLPEDLAEALVENGVAVLLVLPTDTRRVGPKEFKPAGPQEFKAKSTADADKAITTDKPATASTADTQTVTSTPALTKPERASVPAAPPREIKKPAPAKTPAKTPAKKTTPKRRL